MSCEELKELGNTQFKNGNYTEAIDFFNKAIEIDSDNHILYSNRSAAYLSIGKGKEALDDAEKCTNLKPDWIKGWGRKGAALHMLKKYDDSVESFNEGLKLDKDNLLRDREKITVKAVNNL